MGRFGKYLGGKEGGHGAPEVTGHSGAAPGGPQGSHGHSEAAGPRAGFGVWFPSHSCREAGQGDRKVWWAEVNQEKGEGGCPCEYRASLASWRFRGSLRDVLFAKRIIYLIYWAVLDLSCVMQDLDL